MVYDENFTWCMMKYSHIHSQYLTPPTPSKYLQHDLSQLSDSLNPVTAAPMCLDVEPPTGK